MLDYVAKVSGSQRSALYQEIRNLATSGSAATRIRAALREQFRVSDLRQLRADQFAGALEAIRQLAKEDQERTRANVMANALLGCKAPVAGRDTAAALASEEVARLKTQLAEMRRRFEWLKNVCREFNEQIELLQCDLMTQGIISFNKE